MEPQAEEPGAPRGVPPEPSAHHLRPPVDPLRDHVSGPEDAEATLLEFGSYLCPSCQTARGVVNSLRGLLGERARYVFRHNPTTEPARRAAVLAEFVADTTGEFWPVHEALLAVGPDLERRLDALTAQWVGPPRPDHEEAWRRARARVDADLDSARRSGARISPTFFFGGRKYVGPWDPGTMADAALHSVGHRLEEVTGDFARWAPSAGLLLLVATAVAIALANSPLAAAVEAFWQAPAGVVWQGRSHARPLLHWIDHGLLSVFFLGVGLEIKRELTLGRFPTRRHAALPVAAALGGMLVPAVLFALVAPAPDVHGWGVAIATDTAFALALLVLLGRRIPHELRVFLTAAVIVDDVVAIAVVAFFYSVAIRPEPLAAAALTTFGLVWLNRAGIDRPLPYAVLGVVLWALLHASGVHATLAGVLLALVTPTRSPPDLEALSAHTGAVVADEMRHGRAGVLLRGPSAPALRALDAIHARIEAPADKLLRAVEPWSSFVILPLFALANAGVPLSWEPIREHARLVAAIVLGLVVGKPLGVTVFAALAVRLGLAARPQGFSWPQLAGAGALAGVGFTMSLFIAGEAFAPSELAAAKLAVFAGSTVAALLGAAALASVSPVR